MDELIGGFAREKEFPGVFCDWEGEAEIEVIVGEADADGGGVGEERVEVECAFEVVGELVCLGGGIPLGVGFGRVGEELELPGVEREESVA